MPNEWGTLNVVVCFVDCRVFSKSFHAFLDKLEGLDHFWQLLVELAVIDVENETSVFADRTE